MDNDTIYYIRNKSDNTNLAGEEIFGDKRFTLISYHEISLEDFTQRHEEITAENFMHEEKIMIGNIAIIPNLIITPVEYIFKYVYNKTYAREIILPTKNENLKMMIEPIEKTIDEKMFDNTPYAEGVEKCYNDIFYQRYKFYTNMIILGPVVQLYNLSTFKLFVGLGGNIMDNIALQWSACQGHLDIVKYLIDVRGNKDSDYGLVLLESCKRGHFDIFKYVVTSGANISDKYNDALRFSAEGGYLEMVKNLVESGAIFSSALRLSVMNNHFDVAKYLIESGADVSVNNDECNNPSILTLACREGNLLMVKYLVENGADINDGCLTSSCRNSHIDIVKYLVESGADIDDYDLIESCVDGHIDVIKYLIESGADIHTQKDWLFVLACRYGHLPIVKLLIELGANNNDCGLIYAAEYGHVHVIKLLIESGVDINLQSNVILLTGVRCGHFRVVEYFIENASHCAADIESALVHCCVYGQIDIFKYLENKIEYYDNDNCIKMAKHYARFDIFKYITDRTNEEIFRSP